MTGPTAPAAGEEVDAAWLSARQSADVQARTVTAERLLPPLIEHLRGRGDGPLQVVDLGAGQGANQRWLRPRLPFPQHWTHVDYDEAILHRAVLPDTSYVRAPVEALPQVLAELPAGPVLVTCSALLDVLHRDTLIGLGRDLVSARVPALLSLSVTGAVVFDPSDSDDHVLLAAFNDHQRRGGRVGPDAPDLLAAQWAATASSLLTVDTPWQVAAGADSAFLDRFLRERVAAAADQVPDLREPGAAWLDRRRKQLRDDHLDVRVEHRDLLLLPK